MKFERELEPKEDNTLTVKVYCSFETFVTVEDGDREEIEEQLHNMDWGDFLEESSQVEIQDWEVTR